MQHNMASANWSGSTVLSTSLRKIFFAWHSILNKKSLFWSTISYQKPFVFFCFCVLFSNIDTKIEVTAKSWFVLCNSKVIFWSFCLRKYFFFYFSLLNLNYWCFTTILWKFQKILNKWNFLKIWLQVTNPTDFCMIWLHFFYGKMWKYLIF